MEELKELVEVINTLPHLALWIIAGVTLYKVVVVGSIYGVIRYAVGKFVEWKTAPTEYYIDDVLVNERDAARIDAAVRSLISSSCHGTALEGGRFMYSADIDKFEAVVNEAIRKIKEGKK